MTYLVHAVSSGVQHAANLKFRRAEAGGDGPELQMPPWGYAVLSIIFVVCVVFMIAVDYMLEIVVATLAMIETPSSAITVAPSSSASVELAPKAASDNDKDGLLETGPNITLVPTKPITSSIRGTIRHVVAHAGRYARWRGFKSFLLYSITLSCMTQLFASLIPRFPGHVILVTGISGAVLANLHAAVTHKIIAMPTNKSLWQRILPRSAWKQLALPAAVQASAKYAAVYIAQIFGILLGFNMEKGDYSPTSLFSLFGRGFTVFIVFVICALFLILPALVTQVRVEASMLPEDQDTIVPFDRTFGGKVVSQMLGGTGCIGFVDAWKSFTWEARRRLIKLYAKIALITTTMSIAFVHIMFFAVWIVMGPALGEFLRQKAKESGGKL